MAKSSKRKKPVNQNKTLRNTRLFENLLKIAQQFMSGKSYVPLTQPELMDRLGLPPHHCDIFFEVLQNLLEDGYAELSNERYILKKAKTDFIPGLMRMHPRGFGFVKVEDSDQYPEDIFIPKHLTLNAVDGDTVEVAVNTQAVSEKGPEGRVVAILSRSRTHIAGIVRDASPHGDTLAYVPLLGIGQRVVIQPNGGPPLRVGDRVVMEVLDWGSKETETVCRVSHFIGHISEPSCDIKAAIEEFELRSEFPTKVVNEARKLGKSVSRKDIAEREDIRHVECFTIDPDTAKDFDDAISLHKDKEGHYHLGVHIADVSHYVRPGSALDKEASIRCNSTYFPGYCVPMLPGELSENLCSLKANVNRLTVSVFMHFDTDGTLLDHRISRTVIKSAKRFTYREAKEILDDKKQSRHAGTLRLMVELCGLLKAKRYERGSIEFAIPELVVVVDEQGIPQRTDYVAYDITHQLVEEFMLKANEIVALDLSKRGKNLTYRVHDEPAEENMKDFSMLANSFGFKLSENPTARELQELFDEALQTPYGQYLATSYIRRMRLAMYSPENIGHYGLGLTHYCHFTSPIRRYVDLVVHRILFGHPDEREDLEMISHECSEQERISAKAENNVVLLKKLRLIDRITQQDPYKQFEAVVTKVKAFGYHFEVLDFLLEGFLHVSELEDDYFVYDEASVRLRGRRSGKTYSSGDRITVMLKEVDFIFLDSKWSLVPELKKGKKHKTQKAMERKHEPGKKPKKPERTFSSPRKVPGPGKKKSMGKKSPNAAKQAKKQRQSQRSGK